MRLARAEKRRVQIADPSSALDGSSKMLKVAKGSLRVILTLFIPAKRHRLEMGQKGRPEKKTEA